MRGTSRVSIGLAKKLLQSSYVVWCCGIVENVEYYELVFVYTTRQQQHRIAFYQA